MRKAIFILLAIVSIKLAAQVNPQKGYIITNENDTIYGTIDYLTDAQNVKACLFQKAGETEMITEPSPGHRQNRAIQGKVIDEMELLPIIGAYIIVNDSIKIGVTGVDGCFQFETSLPIYKLSFRYIGMEDANLKLSEDCNNIELIMVFMPHYDFMSFQEINIIRKQIYKNLPKLRREAYEKGIFQFPEVCYIQEFSEVNPQDYEGARK